MVKPVLIIGCCDEKLPHPALAFDLYQGALFQQLRANLGNVSDYFEVYILSGLHGLIPAHQPLEPYDFKMCKADNQSDSQAYCDRHSANTLKLLKQTSSNDKEIFVLLFNTYLKMFTKLLNGKQDQVLKQFKASYVSEGHLGIGDLKGRLTRLTDYVKSSDRPEPTVFRSGISNHNETAYLAAGCSGGTSLAHANTEYNRGLLSEFLGALHANPQFLDNGIITLLNQNRKIDTEWVFDQYEQIVSTLSRKQAKNLHLVIPDCTDDPAEAELIVVKHKKQIIKLSKKCQLILPIHRTKNIREHARNLLRHVKSANLVLGVPCLKKTNLDLALDVSDIDALLSLKNADGQPCFTRCHFLGMSDATAKNKLEPRLLLARLHKVVCSLDANRTPAIFGFNKTGLRKGSALAEEISLKHLHKQVTTHDKYVNHNFYAEFLEPNSSPFVTSEFYDLIELDVLMWLDVYNRLMSRHPALQLPSFDESEIDEAKEMAWQMTSIKCVDHIIFDELKHSNWDKFKRIIGVNELTGSEKRFRAIQTLFGQKDAQPYQMTMRL